MLLGNVGAGDLTLTIRNLEEKDSGQYACRVLFFWWDQKTYVTLKVVPGEWVFLFYTFVFVVFKK